MWNRVRKFGYPILAKYIFAGTILAVFVFRFVTISIANGGLVFGSLFNWDTMILIVSILVGSFAGGLVQLVMLPNDKISEQNDYKFWQRLQEKGRLSFLLVFALGISFGGLVAMLTMKILNLDFDNVFLQTLLSGNNIADFIGMALAASVFGLFFALGTIMRLERIYGY